MQRVSSVLQTTIIHQQAIMVLPTRYRGRHFRSRLEARWSVFFDEMGFQFNYEPETFRLSTGELYLPDFYLTDFDWFVEIKPTIAAFQDNQKAFTLAQTTGLNVMVLDGEPDYRSYFGFSSWKDEDGFITFDDRKFSLDVDYFGTREQKRFFSDPWYSEDDLANPLVAFSARYQTAVNGALSERFEAA